MLKKLLTTVLVVLMATLGYSQVVASINTAAEYSSYNTVSVENQLSYAILNADTNIQFSKVLYSTASQKLTLDALEEIQSISLVKEGGEFYLTNMPVASKNLRISLENYEKGEYELHLIVKGKSVPTIIEIEKK
jgi:hypothetical protein